MPKQWANPKYMHQISFFLFFFWASATLVFSHSDTPCLILNTICYKCNCLANLGLEKDKLYVTAQQAQYSSHILTHESAARMNDLDNATGLPATRRQFLVTR